MFSFYLCKEKKNDIIKKKKEGDVKMNLFIECKNCNITGNYNGDDYDVDRTIGELIYTFAKEKNISIGAYMSKYLLNPVVKPIDTNPFHYTGISCLNACIKVDSDNITYDGEGIDILLCILMQTQAATINMDYKDYYVYACGFAISFE